METPEVAEKTVEGFTYDCQGLVSSLAERCPASTVRPSPPPNTYIPGSRGNKGAGGSSSDSIRFFSLFS